MSLPEGVTPYPRWRGRLAPGERWAVVASEEVRRALQGRWSLMAILLGFGWGAASIIEVAQMRQSVVETHDAAWFVDMLQQLRWFALAVAAAIGAPTLLEDSRRGALELYLTRNLTSRGYLLGKAAAVLGLTTITLLGPAILYYLATLLFYDTHPDNWHATAVLYGAAYSIAWGAMVAGLALGLSCVGRSSRAAILLLFGGFVGMHIVVSQLLSGLTGNENLAILSPFSGFDAMTPWLFEGSLETVVPGWWGAVQWGVLTLIGWGLVAWRRPRVRGEEVA